MLYYYIIILYCTTALLYYNIILYYYIIILYCTTALLYYNIILPYCGHRPQIRALSRLGRYAYRHAMTFVVSARLISSYSVPKAASMAPRCIVGNTSTTLDAKRLHAGTTKSPSSPSTSAWCNSLEPHPLPSFRTVKHFSPGSSFPPRLPRKLWPQSAWHQTVLTTLPNTQGFDSVFTCAATCSPSFKSPASFALAVFPRSSFVFFVPFTVSLPTLTMLKLLPHIFSYAQGLGPL